VIRIGLAACQIMASLKTSLKTFGLSKRNQKNIFYQFHEFTVSETTKLKE
jgi:hypothetical protein